jgi:hypothetical protein
MVILKLGDRKTSSDTHVLGSKYDVDFISGANIIN